MTRPQFTSHAEEIAHVRREAKKTVPITDLPIQLFRPVSGDGDHLALINTGRMHFTFLAPTAMAARRKAKEWAQDSCRHRKPRKEVTE